ncbi:hypothetical protein EBR43_10750 [bacterium]|nr:hypothetical protein [bacterium]
MRKIYLFSLLLFGTTTLYGQNSKQEKDTVFIEQIYQDLPTYLVSQRVLEFDSIKANELMISFENWAGQNFRNYDKVRTSKTESQITLNYITSSFSTSIDFYLNMVVEFKDNKIRVKIYDDGNAYKPGSYSGSTYIAGVAARAYHINSYFNDGMIIYKTKPGMLNIYEKNATGSLAYKASVDATIEGINTYIKTPATKKEDDGW